MKVKYNNDLLTKVTSPLGDLGTIIELGVNKSNVPVLWLDFKNKDLNDGWFPASKCNSAPNTKGVTVEVDFKYNIFDNVKTQLSDGIITYMAKGIDDEIQYVVTNKVQGVANEWFPEAQISKIFPVKATKKESKD